VSNVGFRGPLPALTPPACRSIMASAHTSEQPSGQGEASTRGQFPIGGVAA